MGNGFDRLMRGDWVGMVVLQVVCQRVWLGFLVCCWVFMLGVCWQGGAQAASPLECGMVQLGLRAHIQCTVTRDRLEIRDVHLNNGSCRTMQEHYELNPGEYDRLKTMIGYPVASLNYRRTYKSGQSFFVYIMPCHLHDYMIETDQGTWGWLAQRQ
jgi:hypothetical protein